MGYILDPCPMGGQAPQAEADKVICPICDKLVSVNNVNNLIRVHNRGN